MEYPTKSAVVVLRVPWPLLADIDRFAQAQFLTRAEAIRMILRECVGKQSSSWPTHDSDSGDSDPAEAA